MHRSLIVGSVVALHLATLALVLQPPPHRSKRTAIPHDEVALRIRFVRAPENTKPPPSLVPPTSRQTPPRPAPVAAHAIATVPTFPISPQLVISLSASTPDVVAYRPGGFHAALREAQRTPPAQLPGSTGPGLASIRLRTSPSLQAMVHALTLASRCAAVRTKMGRSTTEAITPQLMQRLLDADGCGPQPTPTTNAALIEAVSQQAIFDD